MATDKQIAANRLNATRSTGPKTPEGKERARRNAARHCVLAESVLIKTESARHFFAFVGRFFAEHNPKTPTERALVEAMAVARWRSVRLAKMETVQIDREFDRQSDPEFAAMDNATRTGIAYRDAIAKTGIFNLINREDLRLQRQFDSAFDRLLRYRAQKQKLAARKTDETAAPLEDRANRLPVYE